MTDTSRTRFWPAATLLRDDVFEESKSIGLGLERKPPIWYNDAMKKLTKRTKSLPQSFRPLLWSYDFKKLDSWQDRRTIVHQILAYGTMDDIRMLLRQYGLSTVRREFQRPMRGLYAPAVWELCRRLLGASRVQQEAYVKRLR